MNTLEERVRAALRTHAEDFSADPDAWARIQRRSLAGRKRRARVRWSRPSRFLIPVAAAAAVVAIVVAAVALSDAFGRATGAPAAPVPGRLRRSARARSRRRPDRTRLAGLRRRC